MNQKGIVALAALMGFAAIVITGALFVTHVVNSKSDAQIHKCPVAVITVK